MGSVTARTIGFGIPENISTKMKGALKLKKTLETEKHSYSLEPEKNLKEEEKKKIFPPPLELLNNFPKFSHHTRSEELKERALIFISKLKEVGIEGEIVGINPSPVITVFEFKPAPGIKLSRIINLVDDLALGLSAKSVRIVAPIPGKD
ncbi:MAG: DNA translocase FtsK [bacterium]